MSEDGIEALVHVWPNLIVDAPPVGIPIAVGDPVSWMGGVDFGRREVRWVGRIVGLGYGVPVGERRPDGTFDRAPAARVEANLPQHGKTEVLVHEPPNLVPLDDLTFEDG
jgi:hypothetical protein